MGRKIRDMSAGELEELYREAPRCTVACGKDQHDCPRAAVARLHMTCRCRTRVWEVCRQHEQAARRRGVGCRECGVQFWWTTL